MANGDDINKVIEALQFGNTYPGFAPVSAAEQGGPVAPSDLQQRVLAAIQGVLGRSFKQGDYRSFKVALEASFEYKEVGGRQTYQWKPRAYPLTGGSDLGGGVTGAQYSMVSLAKILYEQTLPLIDNLYSLIPDVDQEQLDAARAIFRSKWSEFVGELGREGGPRPPRADDLAITIYNPEPPLDADGNPTRARGHLIRLGRLLGVLASPPGLDVDEDLAVLENDRPRIARFNVLTTEEEENLTNFIALTDIYLTVDQSWRSYSATFVLQERDLGTGLLSLERLFAVLEESVSEVYIAMDSVNVDQAERLVIPINPDDAASIMVEDLLSWIASFAATEAPQLIREGGKWGVAAVLPTAAELRRLTGDFVERLTPPPDEEDIGELKAPAARKVKASKRGRRAGGRLEGEGEGEEETSSDVLPSAFRHTRVLNPLRETLGYLKSIENTAKAIAPSTGSASNRRTSD